jgi:hypothetical protein
MSLPLNVSKLGLSLDEAAEYAGVSRNTLTRHGLPPTKIGNTKSTIAEFSTQLALSSGRALGVRAHPRLPIGLI